MHGKLNRIHSPDVYFLESYSPGPHYGILVQFMIGPDGRDGEESFSTVVCSSSWLKEQKALGVLLGHLTIMEPFDYNKLRNRAIEICHSADAENWSDLARSLSVLGSWEFENYKEVAGE